MAGVVTKVIGSSGVKVQMNRPMARGARPTGTFNVVRATDGTLLGQVTFFHHAGPKHAHFRWTAAPSSSSMPVPGDLIQPVGPPPT
jgi:hypothetical protein